MVSSFSNPDFPHVHAHPTRLLAMDARLSAAIDSFEVSVRAAVRETVASTLAAIHKAVNPVLEEVCNDLAQLHHDLALGVVGDSDPAPMCSEEAESIEVGHHKSPNDDCNPLRIPSTIHDHSIPPLLSSSPMLRALANPTVKPHLNNSAAATVLLPESKTMTSAPQLLHKHSFSDTTRTGPEVVLNLSIISTTSEVNFPSLLTDNCGAYLKDKFGWVNWYLVGKFVKKYFYALHLFDDMSKRHNTEHTSLSCNLKALGIVVLVCWSLPKDLAASFTEENGTLGHINAIKQFLCLSLLHSCALTVMAIFQRHYSIFTSLLSKLNQELCNWVDVHLEAVFFPNCVANDQIFQQPGWCHTLTDPCDNISYQRVAFNQRNKFNQRNYTIWLMERPCILLSFTVVEENGKRKGFGFVQFDKEDSAMAPVSALNDTIGKGKNLYVLIFFQKSKNDNRLRIFSNTPNPALSQEVVCYKGLQLATNITEACNSHVFGPIVLLLVQIVTTLIRLLEEYANLKGLQDGHLRQEEEVFAILSRKHRNDPFKIKAKLFPYNFQKLLPIVLFLPFVIEQANVWKIAILFCDAALDTIVLQFLLELLGVRKASVGIVKGERATNENVPDITTWAILFEDHCFMVKDMLYLAEMNQHFLDDAYLFDALPLNPRKSLIAQTSYFEKVISMVANSLTSSLNLEIAVKLLFREDGTTTASILLFLFHVMHFKERGESGTKEHNGANITVAMFLIVGTNVPIEQESSIPQYMAELARHVIMFLLYPHFLPLLGNLIIPQR